MAEISKTRADPITRVINFIATTMFVGMMLAALLQILFRFVLKISVPWTEELARILYVYVTFLGLILLEVDNNSIKVSFLVDKLPFKQRFLLQIFLNVFGILFLICLFIGAIIMFRSSNTMNFGTMPFLKVSVLYIPVLIACPLTAFYLVRQLFNFKIKKIEGEDEKTVLSEGSAAKEGTK